jgi:hypothetical protein
MYYFVHKLPGLKKQPARYKPSSPDDNKKRLKHGKPEVQELARGIL